MTNIFSQTVKFVGLSGIGWFLDMSLYLMLGFRSMDLAINNMVSSWAGITFVFIFSTRFVFKNYTNCTKLPLRYKYLMYLLYQALLIWGISTLLVQIYSLLDLYFAELWCKQISVLLAKIAVTPLTLLFNFIVMKGILEKL